MVKIKLIPYRLKIKDILTSKRKHEKLINLENINFPKLFAEFLSENKSFVDKKEQRYFDCEDPKYDKKEDNYYGVIGYGDYGYSAKIIDVETKKLTKKKTVSETEEIPFYYILKIKGDSSIIMINQYKTRGVKTLLGGRLEEFLKRKKVNAGYISLKISPLISQDISKIKKLNSLRFIKRRAPKDIERNVLLKDLGISDLEPFVEEKVIQIRDEKFPFKKYLKKVIRFSQNNEENKYLEIDNIYYDKLKIDIEAEDGTTRTVKIEMGLNFSEGEEIEFKGDFPPVNKFYKEALGYFKIVEKDV